MPNVLPLNPSHALAVPFLETADMARRLAALGRGERLTLIGIDRDGVGDALRAAPAGDRGTLLLDPEGTSSAPALVDRLLDDLAELALDRWPRWYGREDAGEQPDGVDLDPFVSAPWLKAARKRVAAGHPPRFRKLARAFEFGQVLRALDPAGLLVVAGVDPAAPARAAPVIQLLEWCAAQGAAAVAACPTRPPTTPPYDRILYGAIEVVHAAAPVRSRFIPAPSRAHHASPTEARVEAALRQDPELAPLFSANQTIEVAGYGAPRVDLLWRDGRVVVELDGPDHRADPKFAADRHRDYELLVAGYLVLRITNDQVETDLARAVGKIRDVVRFRRATEGERQP